MERGDGYIGRLGWVEVNCDDDDEGLRGCEVGIGR